MTDWTTPESIARLRALCASDGDDAHQIVEAMPQVLDDLEGLRTDAALSRAMLARQCDLARVAEADRMSMYRSRDALGHLGERLHRDLRAERDEARRIVVGVHGALADAGSVVVPCDLDADLALAVQALVAERDEARRIAGALATEIHKCAVGGGVIAVTASRSDLLLALSWVAERRTK